LKLESAVLVNALRAALEQLGVSAVTSAAETASSIGKKKKIRFDVAAFRRLVADVERGQFLIFLVLLDKAAASENLALTLFKFFTDDAALADAAALAFTKSLNDAGLFTDDEVIDFAKSISDNVLAVVDRRQMALLKPLRENVASAQDTAFIFAKKVSDDDAGVGDAINSLGVSKLFAHAGLVSETTTHQIDKAVFDFGGASDDTYRFDFTKVITDPVCCPDDVAASAVVGSETTTSFMKNVVQTAQVSDLFVRTVDYARSPTDAAALGEAHAFSLERLLADTAALVDAPFRVFGKASADTAGASENVASNFGKANVDSAAPTDAHAFGLQKPVADIAATTDTETRLFGKTNADTSNLVDFAQLGFTRVLGDESLTLDSHTVFSLKQRSDVAMIGDLRYNEVLKLRSNLASTTDAGSLRSQGFADFTYFAEDYVGASRTF
jgi:hypothetical protein